MSAQNIDCGYSLEPPRRGGSNEYPQSMFLNSNKKIIYTPANPSFTIWKWGLRGSTLYRHVFVMTAEFLIYNSIPVLLRFIRYCPWKGYVESRNMWSFEWGKIRRKKSTGNFLPRFIFIWAVNNDFPLFYILKLVFILENLKKKECLLKEFIKTNENCNNLTILSTTNQHLVKVRKLDKTCTLARLNSCR